MKILIVLPSSSLGGAERVATILSQECLKRHHMVHIVALSDNGASSPHLIQLTSNGATVHKHNQRRELLGIFAFALSHLVKRNSFYDLIYTTHLHTNSIIGFFRKIRLINSHRHISRESTEIFTRFSGLRLLAYKIFYFVGYGNQDLLICQTQAMKRQLPRWIQKRLELKMLVLGNPVTLQSTPARHWRTQIILCIGRLIPVKNTLSLLKAVLLLRSSGDLDNFKLFIAGDGPLKFLLLDFISKHGLDDCVKMVGLLDDCAPLYRRASIGVLPSIKEGFPNVLLEMMAHGIPQIVSTKCTDAVVDIPGVRVCDNDEISIAESLAAAMKSEDDYSAIYREYVQAMHSPEKFADSVLGTC